MELGRPGTALWRRSRAVRVAQTSGVEPDRATFTPGETQGGEQVARPFMRRGLVNICRQTGLALVHESARGFIKHSFCFRSLIRFNCAPTLGLGGMHKGDAGR